MADTLLQNLTELTSPAAADLLYMVADPSGTPADRKVTFSTIKQNVSVGINVKRYGATGDGTTDDSAAIAAAITAAGVGGYVFFPAGTYVVALPGVTPLEGQTLMGEGRNVSLIKAKSTNNQACVNLSANKTTARNIGAIGNSVAGQGFYIAGTDCVVEDCYADATSNWAVFAGSAAVRPVVRRNILMGSRTANTIEYNGCDYGLIEANVIAESGNNCIEIYQIGSNPIRGTRIVNNWILSATGRAGSAGIAPLGDYGTLIIGNVIMNTAGSGIILQAGEIDNTIYSAYGRIIGNTLKNCGGTTNHGIYLSLARGWSIAGNLVEGSGRSGIFGNSGDSCVITGNVCNLNRWSGIVTNSSFTDSTIADNACLDNSVVGAGSAHGIDNQGARTVITGNTCRDTRGTKLQEFGIISTGDTARIVHNDVTGNRNVGLYNPSGAGVIKQGNIGYITENSGSATITAAATSVSVTHGLATTPTRVQITVTSDWGSTSKIWVSAKASSTFTVTVNAAPGASFTFDWRATVGEG